MDEDQIKLETRLIAIEHLLINLYRLTYDIAAVSDAQMEAMHAHAIADLERETFQGADLALSDLWAAEIRDAVSRLLSAISSMTREARM